MSVEVYRTSFAVKQTTDSYDLEAVRGNFDESKIVVNDPPRATFVVHDPSGVLGQSIVKEGKEFTIRRGINGAKGELRFTGVIENVELTEDAKEGVVLTARGIHKGYKMLQQHICDSYDFDEDGLASTTRDAVTVNPWVFFIFRKPGSTLDARGLALPIDGVRFDDAVKHIIGTKFIHQIDLQDNRYFLASQVYASTNKVQVYRDGPSSDLRPALQRNRQDGSGFGASGSLETIPLENGTPNIDAMGAITSVTVTLIGVAQSGQNPTVAACRGARDGTRQYTTAESATPSDILQDDAVTDTGLDKWVYTFSGADWPGSGSTNSLALKITMPGSAGDANTTKIYYIKVDCVTATDTGLSEGTIDTYDNPITLRNDIDDGDWVDTDFLTMNRLEALEALRTLTESDNTVNDSPHWDAWIDGDLAVHFKERRGSDVTNHTYSFSAGNLRVLQHRYIGNEIAYQTIAYGAGSGIAQTRIVSKEEYSAGGLYDATRDPASGALYGQLARVMKFTDANEKSPTALYRKARAFHKLHRDPLESVHVEITPEFIRHFEIGDSITIKNLRTRTNGLSRVVELNRAWDGGDMEALRIRLGSPLDDLARHIANGQQKHETLVARSQPSQARTGLSGNGVYTTKDVYGFYSFAIPEGAQVDRVKLAITTLPWQITAKGGASSDIVFGAQSAPSVSNLAVTTSSSGFRTFSVPAGGSSGYVLILQLLTTGSEEALTKLQITSSSATTPELFVGEVLFTEGEYRFSQVLDSSHAGETITIFITNRGMQTITYQILPTIIPIEGHTHDPVFGIWQFDGDAGTGAGSPIYGAGIQLAVDPTVDGTGIPTTFAAEKVPTAFGLEGGAQSLELDVTGYLDTDANGIVKPGKHHVYLKGAASANNAQGLAVVSVTPILKFKETTQ